MKLHDNKEAFNTIIARVAERSGIPENMIEKDYYVSMILKELSEKQPELTAYFKGGTCLYKAYLNMKRFSEDIDLTVNVEGLSNSQKKATLVRASEKYECMERLKGDPLEENRKGSITTMYGYEPNFEVDANDRLQRYGKLKVEATSFTISEPYETNTISSLVYQYATDKEKEVLRNQFELQDFDIQNISIERMFADKLLAAEFYYERGDYFDVAKHLYDIHAMMRLDRIISLVSDDEKLIKALSYKREEERYRKGSDLDTKPLRDFDIFKKEAHNNVQLVKSYEEMQRIYVIKEEDVVMFDSILETVKDVKERCFAISDREASGLKSAEQVAMENLAKAISQYNSYCVDYSDPSLVNRLSIAQEAAAGKEIMIKEIKDILKNSDISYGTFERVLLQTASSKSFDKLASVGIKHYFQNENNKSHDDTVYE